MQSLGGYVSNFVSTSIVFICRCNGPCALQSTEGMVDYYCVSEKTNMQMFYMQFHDLEQ